MASLPPLNNKNPDGLPQPPTPWSALFGLLVPVAMLVATGMIGGLLWDFVMPKFGYPSLTLLEADALWFLYLGLVGIPFTVCALIWKAISPDKTQVYTMSFPGEMPDSQEKLLSNLKDAFEDVHRPDNDQPVLTDNENDPTTKKDDPRDENDNAAS